MADISEDKHNGCCCCWCGGHVNDWRKQYGITCTFLVFAGLNIAMLYVGIESIDDCPVQTMIPKYLIVAGSTSLSLLLVRLLVSHILVPTLEQSHIMESGGLAAASSTSAPASTSSSSSSDCSQPSPLVSRVLVLLRVYDSLASIFSTCWLVVGSVYVYGTTPTHKDPEAPTYCVYHAYMFAFVVITIGYVSLFLSVLAAVLACFCNRGRAQEA